MDFSRERSLWRTTTWAISRKKFDLIVPILGLLGSYPRYSDTGLSIQAAHIFLKRLSFMDERVARVKHSPDLGVASQEEKGRGRWWDEGQQMMAWWTAEMAFQCPAGRWSPFRVFLTRQSGRRLVFRLTASITQTRSSIPDGSKRRQFT